MEENPEVKEHEKVGMRQKNGLLTGQKEHRRFVSEGEEFHWVGCCEQWRYTCWRTPEKMILVLVD